MPTNTKLRDYAYTFGSRMCVIALTAFFGILSARLLGPSAKGIYTVATLFPAVLSTIAMLAGPQLVLRDLSNDLRSTRLNRLLTYSLLLACTGAGACLLLQLLFAHELSVIVLAASAMVFLAPTLIIPEYLAAALQARRRFGRLSLLRVLQVALPGGLMLLGVITSGVLGAFLGFGVGNILIGLGAYRAWRAQYVRLPSENDVHHIPWRYIAVTNLTIVLLFFSFRLDVLVLEVVASSAAVGIYTAAVAMAELVLVISMSATVMRSTLYARQRYRPLLKDTWIVFVVSLIAAAGIFCTSPILIPMLFGDAYTDSLSVTYALLPGLCCLAAYRFISNAEIVRGHKYGVLASCVVSIATDVALVSLLAPSLGALGAGVAASISYAAGLLYLVLHRRIRSIPRFLEGEHDSRRAARTRPTA